MAVARGKFTHGSPHIRKRGAHTELRSDHPLLINQHWHHFAGMVAVTNGRIVAVIRHHDQAIIWLHRLNKPGKVTVNDLQTFGITCDVFCMTSESVS